jgi:hypothetical protein
MEQLIGIEPGTSPRNSDMLPETPCGLLNNHLGGFLYQAGTIKACFHYSGFAASSSGYH